MKKFFLPILLILFGIADAGYLTYEHFRQVIPPCTVNRLLPIASDCGKVLRSSYSVMFGVPVAVFGIFQYSLLLIAFLFFLFYRKKIFTYWIIFQMILMGLLEIVCMILVQMNGNQAWRAAKVYKIWAEKFWGSYRNKIMKNLNKNLIKINYLLKKLKIDHIGFIFVRNYYKLLNNAILFLYFFFREFFYFYNKIFNYFIEFNLYYLVWNYIKFLYYNLWL